MMSLRSLMTGLMLCLIVSPVYSVEEADSTAIILQEITVNAFPKFAKLTSDGVQVEVSGTYLANAGTASDVLAKLPFVVQNCSDIEVLGKGTPLIYINGRLVRDRSELNQLASSQIKKVEVVTTPGARYTSSANAVIRISTITPVGEGVSLSDRTTIGYKHYAYLFEQLNINYRKKGLDVFAMINYENYRERPQISNETKRYFGSGEIIQNSFSKSFDKYPVYQGRIGLNYILGNHYFGCFYDFYFKPSISNAISGADRYIDNLFSETLRSSSESDHYDRQHLYSAYYDGNLGTWSLSANFDAIWQNNDANNYEEEFSTVNSDRIFSTRNEVNNRLLACNIVAGFPTWKGSIRFGTEITNIHRTDKYNGSADFITSNDNKINETVSALFAEIQQKFGLIDVTAGLRWEYTDSRFYERDVLNKDQSRKYNNFAPSVSISFPISLLRASLAYTRKTTRPAFSQLSSALKYIDRYSFESGNPRLKPIFRDYVSLSLSWKDLVCELSYLSTKNYFMWQTIPFQEANNATLLTIENMPRFATYETYINYSPTFFGVWHPSLMAGMSVQDFKILHHGEMLKLNKPLGIFRINNAIHIPGDIWVNLDCSARTSGNGENLYIKSYWQCDFGVYRSFANDMWSIKLQLNDIFATNRMSFISYDAISRMSINKINDTRDLTLTIRYNFNTARSRFKGHGVTNQEKERL